MGDGYNTTRGLEISQPKLIEDDVYEEKVQGADAVFAYANVEVTPLDGVSKARLLRMIDLHVSPGYAGCTYCNTWIWECKLHNSF